MEGSCLTLTLSNGKVQRNQGRSKQRLPTENRKVMDLDVWQSSYYSYGQCILWIRRRKGTLAYTVCKDWWTNNRRKQSDSSSNDDNVWYKRCRGNCGTGTDMNNLRRSKITDYSLPAVWSCHGKTDRAVPECSTSRSNHKGETAGKGV